MKLLLTGCTGFIGRELIPLLIKEGHSLTVISRQSKERLKTIANDQSINLIQMNPAESSSWDKEEIQNSLKSCEGVINLAGLLTPQCSLNPVRGAEVNLIGAINVFEGALKHGLKKVAYTSSIGVYGPDHAEFPEPTTHYGSFKLASEGVARAFYEEHGI